MATVREGTLRHDAGNSASSTHVRILHLEDNDSDRLLVEERLKRAGIDFEITGVSTRDEFLSKIERGVFTLIISDSSLPSFSSLEAVSISRQHIPGVPFIIFSGGVTQELRTGAEAKAVTAVISKDKLEALVSAVKNSAEHARPEIPSLDSVLNDLQWPGEAQALFQLVEADKDLGMLAFDRNRRVISWNGEMERLYGLTREEALAKPVIQVLTELGRNGEDLLLYRIIEGIPMEWQESSHVHRRSQIQITVSASFVPFRNNRNVPMGGIVLFRDISTRKRMVQAALMVENAFRGAVEGAADAILVANRDGKILYVNGKLCRMLGWRSSELTEKHVTDLMDVEGKNIWREFASGLKRIGSEAFVHVRFTRNRGGSLDAELSVSTVQEGRMMIVIRDTSDSTAEKEQLRQSKEIFSSLAEGAREVIFAVSRDRRVTHLNEAFTMMTGWSKWIWLERDLSSLVHPDDAALWRYNLSAVEEERTGSLFRLRLRCADGKYFLGECNCSPVLHNGKVTGIWHVIRNVDEPFFPDSRSVREFSAVSREFA